MTQSEHLFQQAERLIPGGVNSPVRAFRGVGGTPLFIQRAQGPYVYDADDRRYIDYVCSWGPMVVGHAHPEVLEAVTRAAADGLSFGAPTEAETQLAEKIKALVPSMDMVRMVNSGTEATMSALRLARGYSGRDTIIKFEGNYHGHVDALLEKAGSGALTMGTPTSPGVPKAVVEQTVTLPYNDAEAVRETFRQIGDSVAAVIVEPVAGNMNCVPGDPTFLQALRQECTNHGSVLIFDEVMSGFRAGLGGAQAVYGIQPDLTCLGKVVGGGMPVGAFGGRREIMEQLSPLGPVYQAGTLAGNPITMAAGLKTLEILARPGNFEALEQTTEALVDGLRAQAQQAGVPLEVNQVGSMFGCFFTDQGPVRRHADVLASDTARYGKVFHALLAEGVYFAPAAFESGFTSLAHDQAAIDATVAAFGKALQTL